jgi:hypothetical protein
MPPMTNCGVLFFSVADWRALQKPMAAMANRWSRPSIECNRPLVSPVPASRLTWAEAAVAVTIRPVAIKNRVIFFMVFFLGLVRGVNGSGLLSGIGSGGFSQLFWPALR